MAAGKYFFVFSLILIPASVVWSASPKKCAAFNEYCLNHWDCCSNLCASFRYRCTREGVSKPENHGIIQRFGGAEEEPETLEDLLNEIFSSNRFSKKNSMKKAKQVGDSKEITTILQIPDNDKEQSTNPTTEDDSHSQAEEIAPNKLEIKTSQRKESFEENKESSNATESSVNERIDSNCKQIGEKCYTNDECCSKRCHGFLHQCVT